MIWDVTGGVLGAQGPGSLSSSTALLGPILLCLPWLGESWEEDQRGWEGVDGKAGLPPGPVPRGKATTTPHPIPPFAFLFPQCVPTPQPLMALPAQGSVGLDTHAYSGSVPPCPGPLSSQLWFSVCRRWLFLPLLLGRPWDPDTSY